MEFFKALCLIRSWFLVSCVLSVQMLTCATHQSLQADLRGKIDHEAQRSEFCHRLSTCWFTTFGEIFGSYSAKQMFLGPTFSRTWRCLDGYRLPPTINLSLSPEVSGPNQSFNMVLCTRANSLLVMVCPFETTTFGFVSFSGDSNGGRWTETYSGGGWTPMGLFGTPG